MSDNEGHCERNTFSESGCFRAGCSARYQPRSNQVKVARGRVHLVRKLVSGIDVQNRKGHLSEECFRCEPNENVGVFAHRPWHGNVFEGVICLAKNEDAVILEMVEMGA